MTSKQAVRHIQETFDINAIYAQRVFSLADKTQLLEDSQRIINEKPKPFVKWVGGKRQLLAQFRGLNLYPPEKFDAQKNTYFEPFLGGGAVFFDLLPKNAVLSDMNAELVITYNVIKNDVGGLIKELKKQKNTKDDFLKVRALDVLNLNDVEIAARFIYLNRTCFNGLYRVNKSGKFNVPYGQNKNPLICDEVNLKRVSKALQAVSVTHANYDHVLKKARKGDFVYFDPPYYPVSKTAAFTTYTKQGFLEQQQVELKNTFLELHKRGCFVMLSNSDTPFINDLYSGIKGVHIYKVEAGRAINSNGAKRGKITEVVVTNY